MCNTVVHSPVLVLNQPPLVFTGKVSKCAVNQWPGKAIGTIGPVLPGPSLEWQLPCSVKPVDHWSLGNVREPGTSSEATYVNLPFTRNRLFSKCRQLLTMHKLSARFPTTSWLNCIRNDSQRKPYHQHKHFLGSRCKHVMHPARESSVMLGFSAFWLLSLVLYMRKLHSEASTQYSDCEISLLSPWITCPGSALRDSGCQD